VEAKDIPIKQKYIEIKSLSLILPFPKVLKSKIEKQM
jgi:hypothetical protein